MSKQNEFSEVLRLHGDMAYRMACHLTGGNEPLARDLVQDAFIKIWKHWESQRPESFKGWLYRILHNLFIDHLRRQKREAASSYDAQGPEDGESLKDRLPEKALHSLQVLEQEELRQALTAALEKLPEDFRVALVLCDIEGLSYEDIAQVVTCPVGTVRSRIHRGRQLLRTALVHLMQDESIDRKEVTFL